MTTTNTYGRQVVVPLTNKSGGSVAAGDVVIVDTSNNDAFTTTTSASFTGVVGVAQETIANNATGRVLMSGYAALVNVPSSVTRGHYLFTHTVAKQATGASSRAAGAFGQFLTGGTTPDAHIFGITDSSVTGLTDPMTTRGDIIVRNASNVTARLAIGSSGKVLSSDGTDISWQTPAAGGEMSYLQLYMPFAVLTATTGAGYGVTTWNDTGVTALNSFPGFQPSSSAQNDSFSVDLWMEAGTYTVTLQGRKSSNTGIVTINLDTVSQGTIDTYAASPAYFSSAVTGITVTAGKRTWQFKNATKNASSSGYSLGLYYVTLSRTA